MKRRRTVTPVEPENPVMNKLNFAGAKIAEFGRADKALGWVNFHVSLGNGSQTVFEYFGWSIPEKKCSLKKLDGSLRGGNFTLTPKDKLVDDDIDIEFKEMTGFAVHRVEEEVEGKKRKIRQLRFKATFDCEDGCANLEKYMMATDNAKGYLRVMYIREAFQTEFQMDDQPMLTDEQSTEQG